MGIIQTSDIVNHPEGGILLRDGSIIEGYSSEQIVEKADNSLRLDTTGVYLSLRKKKRAEKGSECDEEMTLFLNNAWYFYEHYKEICSDSRKFLARVPVQNGLAYTGTSGFRNPTLGVYVEWWRSCEKAVVEQKGEKWLMWYIAGSPLSGSNKCSIVNAEGKTRTYEVHPFTAVWPSFMQVNTRYDECKSKYMAYTIEEVVALMRGGSN